MTTARLLFGRRFAARLAQIACLALALSFPPGCMSMRFGRQPDTRQLEQLERGTSTKADVLRLLGPPSGGGRSQFPVEDRARDLWCYYYEESTMKDAQRIFLFVYFLEGRFDGYMWFSSLPQF